MYGPIENKLSNEFGPFVGNTHTETTVTGTSMTRAYHLAHNIIKKHANAGPDDVILTIGSGMTRAVQSAQSESFMQIGLRAADCMVRLKIN